MSIKVTAKTYEAWETALRPQSATNHKVETIRLPDGEKTLTPRDALGYLQVRSNPLHTVEVEEPRPDGSRATRMVARGDIVEIRRYWYDQDDTPLRETIGAIERLTGIKAEYVD